jgi:predicted transcriptional regulator
MPQIKKTKIRYVEINTNKENFVTKFIRNSKEPDFSDVKLLRKLLSNEKSRILYFLKNKNPTSIYSLAKMLGKDFKSVAENLKILERFGFIEFVSEKKGERESLRPVLSTESVQIIINI